MLNGESGCNTLCLTARGACELLRRRLETSDHTQPCTQMVTQIHMCIAMVLDVHPGLLTLVKQALR